MTQQGISREREKPRASFFVTSFEQGSKFWQKSIATDLFLRSEFASHSQFFAILRIRNANLDPWFECYWKRVFSFPALLPCQNTFLLELIITVITSVYKFSGENTNWVIKRRKPFSNRHNYDVRKREIERCAWQFLFSAKISAWSTSKSSFQFKKSI